MTPAQQWYVAELLNWIRHDITQVHRQWNNERATFGCLLILTLEALDNA